MFTFAEGLVFISTHLKSASMGREILYTLQYWLLVVPLSVRFPPGPRPLAFGAVSHRPLLHTNIAFDSSLTLLV